MTEKRVVKAGESSRRPLLNLGGGDRAGLERAFQLLVRRTTDQTADPRLVETLELLGKLGFVRHEQDGVISLSHPLAPDRRVAFDLTDAGFSKTADSEELALDFAVRHFPEMEFYLPFISLRATRYKRLNPRSGPTRLLPPEPEYDEDGFLAEYP